MAIDIQNKNILITGANRGIGKAIVEGALQRGAAKVYAAVRDVESVKPLVAEFGDRVVPVRLDVTDGESIKAAAATASDVNVVVNNAGVLRSADLLSEDALDAFAFESNVNILGWLRVAQAFAPVLKNNGGGGLVQLNSVASLRSFADFATYSASKAASYSLTQALRETLAKDGISVVSVHPGPIATDMADSAGLTEIAEPASLVGDAIFAALEREEFHAYPDTMAKQFGGAYESFAKGVVEASMTEGVES